MLNVQTAANHFYKNQCIIGFVPNAIIKLIRGLVGLRGYRIGWRLNVFQEVSKLIK